MTGSIALMNFGSNAALTSTPGGGHESAFPSGHALHVGALASAATLLPTKTRNAIWATGAVLVTTRIVLLAHWFTDVAVGLVLGVGVERCIRLVTKPEPVTPDDVPRASDALHS